MNLVWVALSKVGKTSNNILVNSRKDPTTRNTHCTVKTEQEMELELLSAAKLAKVCQLQHDIAKQFTDLRQCSMIFQKSFMDAWMVCTMSTS